MAQIRYLNQKEQVEEYRDNAEQWLYDFFDKPESQKIEAIENQINKNESWGINYHLDPQRKALLSWYEFDKNATLLEVGAGCGALTGLYASKLKKVYSNELMKSRAEVIERRYSDLDNVEILVGSFADLDLKEKVDYISVIGVMEYAGKFYKKSGNNFYDPFVQFMKDVKSYLKPNGKLLLAIENKLGVKYFAGGREDHYGTLMESIDNYPNYNGIRTFTKAEIETLFKDSGFKDLNFYYPYPDYKMPNTIMTESAFNEMSLGASSISYFSDYTKERFNAMSELLLTKSLMHEKVIGTFANSFLIEAS